MDHGQGLQARHSRAHTGRSGRVKPMFSAPRRVTGWACIAGIIAAVPTPHLITLACICVPVGVLLAFDYRRILGLAPAWGGDAWTAVAMLGAQVAALGALLYFAAAGMSRLLVWVLAHKAVTVLVAAVATGLMLSSSFDLFSLSGIEAAPPAHAWEKLSLLFTQ